MGQCGGPQQAGNHPIPGLQTWRAAPLGAADRPGQAWLGLWAPAHAALNFFFSFSYTLRHRFAGPHATAGSTAAFYFQTPAFSMARKKRCPTPRKSHLWFRTYFAKSHGKNADLVKIFSFSPEGKK